MNTSSTWSRRSTTRAPRAPASTLCTKPIAAVISSATALAASRKPTPTYTTSSARVKARATHSRASSARPALGTSGDAMLRRPGQSLVDRVGDGLERVGRALELLGSPAPHVSGGVIDGVTQAIAPQPHHRDARDRAHEEALHLVDLRENVLLSTEQTECRANAIPGASSGTSPRDVAYGMSTTQSRSATALPGRVAWGAWGALRGPPSKLTYPQASSE